ncbi:hypothetical protein [Nonomuraea glycinis]|uniref:hypothetical protein n=1 Tax=Nonomuraea glycinis TaxID=2047744 RepID=UPI0033A6B48A
MRERDLDLDILLTNASRSALESLDAVIDVEQRLSDLHQDVVNESETPTWTASPTGCDTP